MGIVDRRLGQRADRARLADGAPVPRRCRSAARAMAGVRRLGPRRRSCAARTRDAALRERLTMLAADSVRACSSRIALAGVPLMYALLGDDGRHDLVARPRRTRWRRSSCRFIGGVEPFILIAVPLFIFAGELLSQGGVGKRIVDVRARAVRLPAGRARRGHRRLLPDVRRRVRLGDRRHRGDRLAGDPDDDRSAAIRAVRRGAAGGRRHAGAADAAVDPVPRLRLHLRRVDARSCRWPAWCRRHLGARR